MHSPNGSVGVALKKQARPRVCEADKQQTNKNMITKIKLVRATEILDSRGNPSIKTTIVLDNNLTVSAQVPSGASTGKHEALELRDGDPKRYHGKGVLKAVSHVNQVIAPQITGQDPTNQTKLDQLMLELDGTENKSKLGANAILSVSMALTKGGAKATQLPLYRYIAQLSGTPEKKISLPKPMMNVLNGGKHAVGSVDMQEFMIAPLGASSFKEAVRLGSEVFHTLKGLLAQAELATTVGDEGGFAPKFNSNEAPLEFIVKAIKEAGYKPGKDLKIALDPAASEFYDPETKKYRLKLTGQELTSHELIQLYEDWVNRYPIYSIEDGLAEDDWDGFIKMNQKLGKHIQTVGDDLYVTNLNRLQKGIELKATNAILIKPNQVGTITETLATINLAKKHGLGTIISHRSGETCDTFIADLAVGTGAGQIKTGSLSRSERVAKYNRLMEIEREHLGHNV